MTIAEFTHITEQMEAANRKQKAKLLVVDDEPDNIDLLYRTFRRDFQVLKASNGLEALQVLEEEGEVAVIISDQRMPEMKGTEFLSRTVPNFPNTIRIILTGFTDVEDLVEAINAGQVYRYITKPWDPSQLKEVVDVAATTYAITNQRLAELEQGKIKTKLLTKLLDIFADDHPLSESLNLAAAAIAPAVSADGCLIKIVKEGLCEHAKGIYHHLPQAIALPEGDPLIAQAIASQAPRLWLNSRQTPPPEDIPYYLENQLNQHLLCPLLYRQEIIAFLSLQWHNSCSLKDSDLELLHLAGQRIAFALINQKSC
jgi:CheY-like chemotaxis protein